MTSIRRQLLLWLLALLLVAGSLVALGLYFKIRAEANDLFDYQLRQMALSLRDRTLEQSDPSKSEEAQYDFVIQIWDPSGQRVYSSHPHSALPNRARLGFETVHTAEGIWRVFSVQWPHRTVQVAQPLDVRQQLAEGLALRALLPFTALIPVLGALIWIIVGWGLRPLRRVAADVATRSADALTPLPEAGLPLEVRPLVKSLNELLSRLERSLVAQRAFVADAAHQLRTPLTALRLQAQIAERARTDEQRSAAFARLNDGLGRAIHMVQQMLVLARQEPDVAHGSHEPIDLGRLASQLVTEHAALATARNVQLRMSHEEPVLVMGDADGLRAMLSNLIDNAVRYTQTGGKIGIAVAHDVEGPVISVTDDGPGIAPEEREHVLDRFYRGENATDRAGSGLGLAIVKSVVARHKASLTLAEGDGGVGLRASVRFPPVSSPT
jgi:two-component system OmpR family sensor kinase